MKSIDELFTRAGEVGLSSSDFQIYGPDPVVVFFRWEFRPRLLKQITEADLYGYVLRMECRARGLDDPSHSRERF